MDLENKIYKNDLDMDTKLSRHLNIIENEINKLSGREYFKLKGAIIYNLIINDPNINSREKILPYISDRTNLQIGELTSNKNGKLDSISYLRSAAALAYKKLFNLSSNDIEKILKKDHTTVLIAVKKLELTIDKYKLLIDKGLDLENPIIIKEINKPRTLDQYFRKISEKTKNIKYSEISKIKGAILHELLVAEDNLNLDEILEKASFLSGYSKNKIKEKNRTRGLPYIRMAIELIYRDKFRLETKEIVDRLGSERTSINNTGKKLREALVKYQDLISEAISLQ